MSSPRTKPGHRPDVAATRLWVTAIGLVGQAEESLARGSLLDFTASLILADTATEAVLGLMASNSPSASRANESHETWLLAAAGPAHMSKGLVTEIRNIHRLRNQAAHNGYEATLRDAERATVVARQAIDLVPRVLKRFKRLPRSAGVASAVASVIETHPISRHLLQAQLAVSRGRHQAALESIAWAHQLARTSVEPALPHMSQPDTRGLGTTDPGVFVLAGRLRPIEDSVRAIEKWLTPIALGVRPAEYSRLSSLLPSPLYVGPNLRAYHWHEEPNLSEARWAVERVSMIVLRLWESDSLSIPTDQDAPFGSAPRREDHPTVLTSPSRPLRRGESNQRGASVVVRVAGRGTSSLLLRLQAEGVQFASANVGLLASAPIKLKANRKSPSELVVTPARLLPQGSIIAITDIRFDVDRTAKTGLVRTTLRLETDGDPWEGVIGAVGSVGS